MSCTLKPADRRRRLARLEAEIDAGAETFHRIGHALLEISRDELYKLDGFESFDAYIRARSRWRFSPSYAYRLIVAAEVVDGLSPNGEPAPANEAQARELAPLSPTGRRAVWREATDGGQNPTTAARLGDLRRRAMASLTPDEQQEVISGCEAEVIAGQESAAQVGGEGRKGRLAAVDRALKKAGKLAAGLGDEVAEGVNRIERARAWFAALSAE